MTSFGAGSSALICLDLQRGRLRAEGAEEVIQACRRVLEAARARHWPILHVHRREPVSDHGRPIAGLEPLPSEAVYFRHGPSAFSNRGFRQAARALGGPLALIGFSLADTVLATAFAAADRELPVDVIGEAVAVGGPGSLRAALSTPLTAMTPLARILPFNELFPEGVSRFAAANMP
jgi:nicotinamidase-related amidase